MRLKMMVPVGRRASGAMITARLVAAALAMLALSAGRTRASGQAPAWPAPDVTYAAGQGGRITGPIVSRRGDDILVRDETTKQLSIVTLKSDTKITQPTGFMKLDKKNRNDATLIPGLVIVVKGSGGDRGNLMADAISFHKSSLRTASQISAGEVELKEAQRQTAAVAAANTDSINAVRDSINAAKERARDSLEAFHARIANLDAYDVKFTTTVNFEIGSAALSDEAKATLDDAVTRGMGLQGYLIEVAGFADTTGTDKLNQRLSMARARAVASYLTEVRSVPLRRFVSPAGLGTSRPVAPNDTPEGRAQNRRVEVKVLVNRGLVPPAK